MQNLIIYILVFMALVNVFLIWLIFRKKGANQDSGGLSLILQQMNELAKVVDSKIGESREEMQNIVQRQFGESKRLIQEINQEMSKNLVEVAREQTKTNEATRQFMTIAEQLANLEKVLKHQKQRGNLGEASLELILSNILPPNAYKMQYSFENGDRVDAIILTKEGSIPVDAKFSLDNYNRVIHATTEDEKDVLEKDFRNDLKKRIDETAKYVRQQEGTLPFAFMFIPAEAIYYDLLINEVGAVKVNTRNLIDYAYNEKKVIIVSPTTFAAYLQSVLYGFKAFKIEETAKDIMRRVSELGKHLKSYEDFYLKLGNSLKVTVNHYNSGSKELLKIDKDILRIAGESPGLINETVEKPDTENI